MKIPAEHADFFFDAEIGKLPTTFVVADHREQMKYHDAGKKTLTTICRKAWGAMCQNGWASRLYRIRLKPSLHRFS